MGGRSSSATLEGVKGPPGGRHGFFPSPYGTGMVPTSTGVVPTATSDASTEISPPPPPSGRFRVMLPLGEEPPEGYTAVGKRTLPAGDMLLDYVAAQQQVRATAAPLNLIEPSVLDIGVRLYSDVQSSKLMTPTSFWQLLFSRVRPARRRWFNFPARG